MSSSFLKGHLIFNILNMVVKLLITSIPIISARVFNLKFF